MSQSKRVIVITGVPGTGKTSLSNLLKKRLQSAEVIHVTEVVNKKKLFSSYAKDGSKIVNLKRLKAELDGLIDKSDKKTVVLESHLLCEIRIKNAKVIVLREHLSIIKRRLEKRGYGKEKIRADLVSEATDYCGIVSAKNYSHVFETFARDPRIFTNIMKIIEGKEPASREIDLLPEFQRMASRDRSLIL